MKKTIFLALAALVSCQAPIESSIGPIRFNLPSGWVSGLESGIDQAVCVTLHPRRGSDSIETIFPDIERMIGNPARFAMQDGSVAFKGAFQIPYNRTYVKTRNFTMTGRDLAIETARIEKTDTSSNILPVDIARINVREMVLMLEKAHEFNLMPTTEETDAQVRLEYSQAEKSRMTKEMFLANWGITEEEFRWQVIQKLAYEKVIMSVAGNTKSNQEFVSVAGKFKNDLLKTMDHEVFDIAPEEVLVIPVELDNAFAIVVSFGAEAVARMIASSIKLTGQPHQGQTFIFSRSR